MKSAAYIQRLFKDYRVLNYQKAFCPQLVRHTFELRHRELNVICRYDIMIWRDDAIMTAKQKREQAQAAELVMALDGLPRY